MQRAHPSIKKMENEQVEQVEKKTNLSTSSKYEGLAAAKGPQLLRTRRSLCNLLAAELMIGFWFGIGAILAIKTVNNLEDLIRR